MKKRSISGWMYLFIQENYTSGLNLRNKFLKWKEQQKQEVDYHDRENGCQYGYPDGPDDYIGECECDEAWWN